MVNLAENVSFAEHYRPALLWLAAPIVALLAFLLLVGNVFPEGLIKSLLFWLCVGLITVGMVYRYGKTWHIKPMRHVQIQAQDLIGCLLSFILTFVLIVLFQVVFAAVVWPFTEIYRQGRFLSAAWQSWQTGQVLLGPEGQLLRAASHLQYHAGNKPLV